jgi:hypothetical protein
MKHYGGGDGQLDGEAGEAEEAADGSGDGCGEGVGAAIEVRATGTGFEGECDAQTLLQGGVDGVANAGLGAFGQEAHQSFDGHAYFVGEGDGKAAAFEVGNGELQIATILGGESWDQA